MSAYEGDVSQIDVVKSSTFELTLLVLSLRSPWGLSSDCLPRCYAMLAGVVSNKALL